MSRFAIDPPDDDRYEVRYLDDPISDEEAEAEKTRDTARAIFVASLRDYAFHDGWAEILTAVSEAFDGFVGTPITTQIHEYAALYRWPSVFLALADAMDADQRMRDELEARR